MKLYGLHLSPYFERAYLALVIKGATDKVELPSMPGPFGSNELKAASPMGKIPYLLLDDGTCLPEGQMIAEYFDRVFSGPDLEPSDALSAVQARLVARIVDQYIAPHSASMSRHMFGRFAPDETAIELALSSGLPPAFDFLEHTLTGGKFAVGDQLSFGDIALIPHMYFFENFLSQYKVSPCEGRVKFTQWWQANKKTQLVTECHGRIHSSLDAIMSSMK